MREFFARPCSLVRAEVDPVGLTVSVVGAYDEIVVHQKAARRRMGFSLHLQGLPFWCESEGSGRERCLELAAGVNAYFLAVTTPLTNPLWQDCACLESWERSGVGKKKKNKFAIYFYLLFFWGGGTGDVIKAPLALPATLS